MKLLKLLVLGIFILSISLPASTMEEYSRKSISIFKMNVSPAARASLKKKDLKFISDELFKKFVGMGRFDYNPIPAGVSNPKELFKIVKEYTETKIEDRAKKQWKIKNDYYGSNFITGENVDKIMNGAYILFPSLEVFTVVKGKDKKGEINYTTALTVKVKVYSATNKGTADQPIWEPKLEKTISAFGTNVGLGGLLNLVNFKPTKDKRHKSIKEANNAMLLFLQKKLKQLDMFKIKALVTKAKPSKDEITFNFGKNVGIELDDAYTVGYFDRKNGKDKYVETGYMKVRKTSKESSMAQLLIVSNPGNEKESDLFYEGNQVYEHALIGLNILVNGGINKYRHISDFNPDDGSSDSSSVVVGMVGLEAEYDLAKFIGISEFYAVVNGEYMFVPERELPDEVTMSYTSLIYEIGLRKKIFFRRTALYFGAYFGYNTSKLDSGLDNYTGCEDFYTIGGKVDLGVNFMLTKQSFVNLGAGYRFYSNFLYGDDGVGYSAGDEVYKDDSDEVQDLYTPRGFTIKAGFGFTL